MKRWNGSAKETFSLCKRALFANGGNLMISFLAIGAVVGIILGLRFKVLVLVPASLLSTGVVTAVGLLDGQQLKLIALTAVAVAALLQIGYVVGCVVEVAAPWRVAGKSGRTIRYRRPDTEPLRR